MAVNRWFMGIEAKHNFHLGGTYVVTNNGASDTYLTSLKFACTDLTNGAAIYVHGTLADTPFNNPADLETAFYHNLMVTSLIGIDAAEVLYQLEEGTILYLTTKPNAASAMNISVFGNVAMLPHTEKERTFEDVRNSAKQSNNFPVYLYMPTAASTEVVMEKQIDAAKPIVQPIHQATPAVADELNYSSTSANDCLYGWDAVIKGTPPYTLATANGLTQGVTYYFKVNSVEYSFTAGVAGDFSALITTLETITALDALVEWSIVDGEFRCTSKSENGTIALAAGTTGADMFAALTDYDSLHGSVNPTGAQKISFDYYDTTLKTMKTAADLPMYGETIVDIATAYPDVYCITRMWVSQVGSGNKNAGDIFLHDDA